MQAKIETLKAKNADDEEYLVYPRTLIKCVTNENGDSFEDTVKEFVKESTPPGYAYVGNDPKENPSTFIPNDADRLNGHDADYFAKQEDVTNIIDGTQTVGDSAKLGGKDASEYFHDLGYVRDGSILSTIRTNIQNGYTNGYYYAISPSDNPAQNVAVLVKYFRTNGTDSTEVRALDFINMREYFSHYTDALDSFFRWHEVATTADLANYLPITGGTIRTQSISPLAIDNTYEGSTGVVMLFSLKGVSQGWFGFQDGIAQVLEKGTICNLLHTGNMADYVLPITGGTITGNVTQQAVGAVEIFNRIQNTVRGVHQVILSDGSYHLFDKTNGMSLIESTPAGETHFYGTASRNIKYTDKPSGTYTGNGSATARQISIGGIGGALFVVGNNGSSCIVGEDGAFGKSGATSSSLVGNGVAFISGILYSATDDAMINASGVTYKYWVL